MKDNYKSKAKNLTDAICRSLPHLDKRYMKPGDFPGLEFWVQPGGSKSWYYQFRIKGTKDQLRKKIGTYPTIGVTESFNRANILAKTNRESLFSLLKNHKKQFIDMNKYFENFNRDDLYAVQGPHLSPKGYKLVADKINKYISK